MKDTSIAWARHSFNPWTGCVEAGPECDHCYAREFAERIHRAKWGKDEPRVMASEASWRELRRWNDAAAALDERHRVFVASMGDVLENRRDLDAARRRLWDNVEALTSLDFLLLTKRPAMFGRLTPEHWRTGHWPRNAWAGTTCGHQSQVARIRALLDATIYAPVRFVSAEPLLGPLDFTDGPLDRESVLGNWSALDEIGWVIVGGESGRQRREMDLAWLASIADECAAAGVPLFVKQDSALKPGQQGRIPDALFNRKEFPVVRP